MSKRLDLIADGIENPRNAQLLMDVAALFGSSCYFIDRKGLRKNLDKTGSADTIRLISRENALQNYSPVLALENLENAADIFAFRLSSSMNPALVVGNEKFGISYEMRAAAEHVLQIPMTANVFNALDVGSAAAVALFYLSLGHGGRMPVRTKPQRHRPELLLVAGDDHGEIGSCIRSACALGWERVFLDDRFKKWFGNNRSAKTLTKSWRSYQSVKVAPVSSKGSHSFKRVSVLSRDSGVPLQDAELDGGPEQLLVIPDEKSIDLHAEEWQGLGDEIEFVRIDVPAMTYAYHCRIFASIALAESSRQAGQKPPTPTPSRIKQGPVFDKAFSAALSEKAELVLWEDLLSF